MLLAQRINEATASSNLTINNNTISFSVSIGVAELTESAATIDALLSQADAALYAAKAAGRNCVKLSGKDV
jgi:diguanylate cyclase (GGDEF)-like protein